MYGMCEEFFAGAALTCQQYRSRSFCHFSGDLFGPGDSRAGTCYRIKRIFGGMAFVHKLASKLMLPEFFIAETLYCGHCAYKIITSDNRYNAEGDIYILYFQHPFLYFTPCGKTFFKRDKRKYIASFFIEYSLLCQIEYFLCFFIKEEYDGITIHAYDADIQRALKYVNQSFHLNGTLKHSVKIVIVIHKILEILL